MPSKLCIPLLASEMRKLSLIPCTVQEVISWSVLWLFTL